MSPSPPPPERRRVPGWLVVLAMAAFVAAVGTALYFAMRPDPTLPIMTRR